jgi:hypothetical protein
MLISTADTAFAADDHQRISRPWRVPFDPETMEVYIDFGRLKEWQFRAKKRIHGVWSQADIDKLVLHCKDIAKNGMHVTVQCVAYYIAHYRFEDTKAQHEVQHQLQIMYAKHNREVI